VKGVGSMRKKLSLTSTVSTSTTNYLGYTPLTVANGIGLSVTPPQAEW